MIFPARLYVTVDEVLTNAGRVASDDPTSDPRDVARANGIAELASIIVESVVGHAGVVRHLLPTTVDATSGEATDRPPSGAHEAALTISADLWRRPSTPGGYFQVADYVGRMAVDPASPVLALLTPYKESWSIA